MVLHMVLRRHAVGWQAGIAASNENHRIADAVSLRVRPMGGRTVRVA